MMDRALVDRIARSVLYEGYMLYPYRPSSLKNAKRLTFGTLYPRAWAEASGGSDRWFLQTEVLFQGRPDCAVSISGRFLVGENEKEVEIETKISQQDGVTFGLGEMTFRSTAVEGGLYRLTIVLRNTSELEKLGSAHVVISVSEGELISLTDPPAAFSDVASECKNDGVWPVLIGPSHLRDTMLASPIILPDYPQVAPESSGDLCDGTEIEEILALRILTLTDEEKAEVRVSDERARQILERAEFLPAEHLMKLHGTIRGIGSSGSEPWSEWDNWANRSVTQSIRIGGVEVQAGDRVRLRPSKRADIMDSALDGRIAVIAGIEEDFDNRVQVAVVVEDDPGRDLGEMRQTGHRFFFSPEEMELP